jgi:hypothetical protein
MIRFARAALTASAITLIAGSALAAENVTIHSFGGADGRLPSGVVADAAGVLYGTMYSGGTSRLNGSPACHRAGGCGTIFRLAPPSAPGQHWTFQVLYDFQGLADGANPQAPPVVDAAGNLYGTASNGGSDTSPDGAGVVWELSPPAVPGEAWTYTVLHTFPLQSTADGWRPAAGVLLGSNGVLYGVTEYGGPGGWGVAYSLTSPAQSGQPWTEAILGAFTTHNGGGITKSPVLTDHGTKLVGLSFGSAPKSGEFCSVLYEVELTGGSDHVGVRAVIPQSDATGGFGGPPLIGRDHTAYYTAVSSGTSHSGTIGQLTPPTTPGEPWTETTIYTFDSVTTGFAPLSGLLRDGAGSLFGTLSQGGPGGHGSVYRLDPPTDDGTVWTYTLLHGFTGSPGSDTTRPDGSYPDTSLVFGYKHRVYGGTSQGGRYGHGTVFMQSLH